MVYVFLDALPERSALCAPALIPPLVCGIEESPEKAVEEALTSLVGGASHSRVGEGPKESNPPAGKLSRAPHSQGGQEGTPSQTHKALWGLPPPSQPCALPGSP